MRGLAHRYSSCIRPFKNGLCNCPFWPRIFPQKTFTGSSWPYSCWVYNYLSNQFILPLTLRVWIPVRERCTTLYDKVCQWLPADLWLSPGTPSSSTNKIDCQDTTEIFLKVALNTIKLKPIKKLCYAQVFNILNGKIYFIKVKNVWEIFVFVSKNSLWFVQFYLISFLYFKISKLI